MDYSKIINKALGSVRPVFRLHWYHGAHGIAHWSRVWYHGRRIARAIDVNPAILAWFAYLHDSQRHNEYSDPLHGKRAVDFALQLRKEGTITELASDEFEQLCEAMRLHSDGLCEAQPAICACWDADRLDLGRVGITPDPKLLCTSYAKRTDVIEKATLTAGKR
jgi:uncharacterized protein